MTALLLAFLLFQVGPKPTGFATGIVRSASGSPAPGVRVYAMPAGDPSLVSGGAAVIESLAQTDASGRYRLEIPAGRYYIAVGAVSAPTFYPDTTSIASAKAISIAAGTTVESVDFSRYIAAAPSPSAVIPLRVILLPPGSTGVLAGVIRASDGSVASGVPVRAVPVAVLSSPIVGPISTQYSGTALGQQSYTYQVQGGTLQQIIQGGLSTFTDNQGRYRIENVTPETYYIMAGFSDAPVFYPGTSDVQKATSVPTISTTMLTNLDFTMPPAPKTFPIRGHVSANAGRPVGGATLNLQALNSGVNQTIIALLPSRSYRQVATKGDGTFEIPDVLPGKYSLQVRLSVASALTKLVDIVDHDADIDFDLSVNVLSGRIVWEDGSPFSDPAMGPVAVSTTATPNFVSTTLLPVANNGAFSGVIDPGDYRFYVKSLPAGYSVRTMTSGSKDLTREPLQVRVDAPSDVEIRVSRESRAGSRVRGRILDAVTGAATVADRIELCCFATGPFERLSSAVLSDGSFDFSSVPQGRYTAELLRKPGQAAAAIVNQTLDVWDQDKSGLLLVSASQLAPMTVKVAFESDPNSPSGSAVTVAMLISPGTNASSTAQAADAIAIPLKRLLDGTLWLPFPPGVAYSLSVGNIPEGYEIKSISGPGATSAFSAPPSGGGLRYSASAPGDVSIVLQRIAVN